MIDTLYTPLPLVFKKSGFTFTQVVRCPELALYRQEKDGQIHGHEVVLVRNKPAEEVFGRTYEAREAYPGDEAFGVTGFSVGIDPEYAMQRYYSYKADLKKLDV